MSSVHLGLNGWSDPLPASDPIHHQALISWHLVIWTYTPWISHPKLIINLSWLARYCGHLYTLQPLYLVILVVKGWILFHLQSCVFLVPYSQQVVLIKSHSCCSSVGWTSMMRISFHPIPKLLYRTEIFSFWTVLCKPWRSAGSDLLRAARLAPTIKLCSKSKVKSPFFPFWC